MSRKRSTDQQIEDLTKQLLSITKQLDTLRVQVQEEHNEAQAARRTSQLRPTPGLQIGDRAIVLNDYQNLQGTKGTVIRLSTTFVTIRTASGREITRATQNIRYIPPSEDDGY